MIFILIPIFMLLFWLPVDLMSKIFPNNSFVLSAIYACLFLLDFVASLSLATYLTSRSFKAAFKGRLGEWKVSRVVKKLGFPIINNVILDDGEGRLTQIDHLVLLGDHIAVVETKAYSGEFSHGQTRDEPWHRTKGDYPVQSPQAQNHRHVEYVEKHVGDDVSVIGYVVITGRATFVNGWPSDVYSLDTFFNELVCCKKGRIEERVVEAWSRLNLAVRRDRMARRQHLLQLMQDRDARKISTDRTRRAYLHVPYGDKDKAKSLGARWDDTVKQWYVPTDVDPALFDGWYEGQAAGVEVDPKTAEAMGAFVEDALTLEDVRRSYRPVPRTEELDRSPDRSEQVYLDVPYEDKDMAKSLGARWDAKTKRWYVPKGIDPRPFAAWHKSQTAGVVVAPVIQEEYPEESQPQPGEGK